MGLVGLCHRAFLIISWVQTFFFWEFCGFKLILNPQNNLRNNNNVTHNFFWVQRFFSWLFCRGRGADLDTTVNENNLKTFFLIFFNSFEVDTDWNFSHRSFICDKTTSTTCSKHDTRELEIRWCSEIRKLCVSGRWKEGFSQGGEYGELAIKKF